MQFQIGDLIIDKYDGQIAQVLYVAPFPPNAFERIAAWPNKPSSKQTIIVVALTPGEPPKWTKPGDRFAPSTNSWRKIIDNF